MVPKLAGRIDHHWYRVVNCRCDPMNIADKAAVVHVRTVSADTDNVSARRNAEPAEIPRAVLDAPVVFLKSAPLPIAVLPPPVVLLWSAVAPMAVFEPPMVLLWSA